jgi:Rrf2 family protein
MKLSTKSRYGTRAMIDIAIHSDGGTSMLKDISKRQAVSPKYLDHILSSLRKAGLIKNLRGKSGGYSLTRPASAITLHDIIKAVEGSIAPVECVDNPVLCDRTKNCATRDVWIQLKDAMENVLESTTLEKLIQSQIKKNPLPADYNI